MWNGEITENANAQMGVFRLQITDCRLRIVSYNIIQIYIIIYIIIYICIFFMCVFPQFWGEGELLCKFFYSFAHLRFR